MPGQRAVRHRVALPLHPEYRTLPMVRYIPPLSPVADVVYAAGYDPGNPAAPPGQNHSFRAGDGRTHFNLLGWNGQDTAPGLFPGRGAS